VGDFGAGRVAVAWAGGAPEVLALRDGALELAGALAAVPLCAGESGAVFGAYAPGTGVLVDALSRAPGTAPPRRSARLLYGVAAAPRGGPVSFAALGTDLRLELLGPELQPAEPSTSSPTAPALPAVGTGFALADLDGDGVAEIVASAPTAAPPDRVRVLAARPGAAPLLETGPVEGAILAGAGGDLTGDGLDDAVLAAIVRSAGGVATELLLVTSDPREAP
jgi:FG-GAP repeat protein